MVTVAEDGAPPLKRAVDRPRYANGEPSHCRAER